MRIPRGGAAFAAVALAFCLHPAAIALREILHGLYPISPQTMEQLKVFATNRSQDEEMDLTIEVADRAIAAPEGAELLTGPDAKAANSFEAPDVIRSQGFDGIEVGRPDSG